MTQDEERAVVFNNHMKIDTKKYPGVMIFFTAMAAYMREVDNESNNSDS